MRGRISFYLLLFLTGCCDFTLQWIVPTYFHNTLNRHYLSSANHIFTPNLFGAVDIVKCLTRSSYPIDEKDIETILEWHNYYRNTVASGLEMRGDPGPQRPAKFMLELVWDDELADLAEDWALQCNLFKKDQCRDVEQFKVWQNVHLLDMNSVGNSTSAARLHFHIQSWYDEVEDFDSAEFGYVNYTARSNLSYIAFASATINRVGCGRVIYTVRLDVSTRCRRRAPAMALHTIPFGIGDRVETLVCNYRPLDWKTPGVLYEDGLPAHCPPRTVRSLRYGALCRTTYAMPRKSTQWPSINGSSQMIRTLTNSKTNGTSQMNPAIYLAPLILLLLTRLTT